MRQSDYEAFKMLKDLMYEAGQGDTLDDNDRELRDRLITRLLIKKYPDEANKIKEGN
jgi:hypothetical protein